MAPRTRLLPLVNLLLLASQSWAGVLPERLVLDYDRGGHFEFGGAIGARIDANRKHWLLRAPAANPGLLSMFQTRDRQPTPDIVPWAGEFVGKYLISAIQALRMTDDPELETTVRVVVRELLASQAEDGYLGPFPKQTRLLANWDLWGHYHCMIALLMWHEHSGDSEALQACTLAADLVCATYLDTQRRVFSAGSHEMNMAIIHGLGRLYRATGRPRYFEMMRHIEHDWQQAGDYFRTGVAGVEFFRTPKPRWESLHDLQGLVELYRITGDPRYRLAFLNHWQSIRRWDRRNSGAFSSGEQADGDPYRPSAIETCCTIAWMFMTADTLCLTGDPLAADELERATFNLVMGAQHPSGSWWTYDTPMDGAREASADTIVFQARAGTPELNCCSAGASRGLGLLSEWAVMRSDEGLAINYLGPMRATVRLAGGATITVVTETDYPLAGNIHIQVCPEKPAAFPLQVRIPAWSHGARIDVPGAETTTAMPGTFFEIRRTWKAGDQITLDLDLQLRYEAGDRDMFGRASIFRGPLLLAYDARHNTFDENDLPILAPTDLSSARVSLPQPDAERDRIGQFTPMLLVDIPTADNRTLRLCDYGSAGCTGSRYISWLPARDIVPPPPVPDTPANGADVGPGPMVFTWRRPAAADVVTRAHTIVVSRSPDFGQVELEVADQFGHRAVVPSERTGHLQPRVDYYWKLVARNSIGATESVGPAKYFRVDPDLSPLRADELSEFGAGPAGILAAADLLGHPKPSYGSLAHAQGWQPAPGVRDQPRGAVELDGQTGLLVYNIRAFPGHEYTLAVWLAHHHTANHLGQVFSAWNRGMDDPLRICIDQGKLFARIEAGMSYSSAGLPVTAGRWYHVAAVKDGDRLTLYVDAKPAASMQVPVELYSAARDFALGGNPHFRASSEHLAARLAGLRFYVRALTPDEIRSVYAEKVPQ